MEERTMEELLRAPTEGYGEAIVLPEINADHFEIKTNLLQLISQTLDDESWVEAMQEELLQFKIQKVWTLVDLPSGKKAIDDIIFGSTKKSLCDEFEQIMHNRFQMSSMGELTFLLGLQVKQKEDGIFISQDKYVGEILKKFGFSSVKTASTPMETNKALTKDEDGEDVDIHLYRSMIGSLMYLTSSRPDIMFSVCACSRFQVQPKCKKQNVVANSTTEAEYIAASHCCGQNPVYHNHIEMRHHFIRDSYEKRLIEMVKIHTDNNVADLLIKAFDVSRFNFLVASIGKRGRDTKIPQSGGPPIKVGDEAVHKELSDRMERTATTASKL
ncbi:putative ribonuclease H-like domain-containing protein [Tanacetum coccineum]|uniref:Ribonuclease H-like domain-containing protein n=1 Tax=Tanacetum coccineum TaxID=301880 RepID=A0ABQ5J320_9ASTR